MNKIRAACIQMDAGSDLGKNLAKAEKYFLRAVKLKAKWIAFPEVFLWRGPSRDLQKTAAKLPDVLKHFQTLAQKHRVSILLGSLIEKAVGKKHFNTSILINERGQIVGHYRKIHLFDADIPGARCMESKTIRAGTEIVSAKLNGIHTGMAVCYDLRFPELFRELSRRGARVLFLPANFTETTGKAHWETLLKARAIENLAFVIAPGQSGKHPETKIKSFGTSLIIDPWGRVLARGSRKNEHVITADLNFKEQARIRKNFPVLSHTRL